MPLEEFKVAAGRAWLCPAETQERLRNEAEQFPERLCSLPLAWRCFCFSLHRITWACLRGSHFRGFRASGKSFSGFGFFFSFHFGLACYDGTIRRVGHDIREAGRARGLHAWAAIEVSVVGSMHHASRGEVTSTVWIGGEIGLPSQKHQRVVTMTGLGVGLQDDDVLPWGKASATSSRHSQILFYEHFVDEGA